ncbi:MAG TPA: PLP-dependent transferase, partial [Naasia sp.]
TWTAFEDGLGALEGGRCLAFASGMAAAAAVLDLVPAGGRVVVPRHSYQGTLAQLRDAVERGRLLAVEVDIADTDAVIAAAEGAALVWIENPTNPALEVADVDAIAAAAHAAGALVVADNTFATPLLRQPLRQGADIVLHSATKAISGHSDVLLGAVVTASDDLHADLLARRSLHGAVPAPFETYLALRGLRTLPLRLERGQANAEELVRRLSPHPAVETVRYPGFGTILSVVLADAAAADAFVAAVRLCRHATSLGGVETTLERRRRWPGEAATIPEGLVRISAGVENIDDLSADLLQALDAAAR